MRRYHGFLAAPALLPVEHTDFRDLGAEPYAGPERPAGF